MEAIYVHGGISLQGQVRIQGSKNAVLPIMAGTILTGEVCELHNCPKLKDVYYMQNILESLGCSILRKKDVYKIDTAKIDICHALCGMPQDAVKGMRSSIILLGALIGSLGQVTLEYPGGCVIGERPIDIHLDALKKMNVVFKEDDYGLHATTTGLIGAECDLRVASVGATENILLAAVKAKGITIIRNAAKEPEIVTLCHFLTTCGASIKGAGTSTIVIEGVNKLHGCAYNIPGDRIVAGTYLCACMAAGGEVLLRQAPVNHMEEVLRTARRMGAVCHETDEGLYVVMRGQLKAIDILSTGPYPLFPTDMQSLFVTVLSVSEGSCIVNENVFENRFHTIEYLQKMGADIDRINDKSILIHGVKNLKGYTVSAKELRGGAALVVAGVCCKGETIIDSCHYIERGYENICRDLRDLGVRIYGV